eukprot:TRINITY_DN2285_c0_g2_i1.p1 TRINITY_DN2285_c0_g2~~TRINITY_DN2285_c0_g2_i1.p1  ORF type:complete len:301 (-),score=49.99 TRINITY_DN2285_c0_g2_i1:185-1087(-)
MKRMEGGSPKFVTFQTPRRSRRSFRDRTSISPRKLTASDFGFENSIVYLNIGGFLYTTDKNTLFEHGPNYFTAILEGNFHSLRDDKDRIFINRPGKYFEPILEYMITGDLNVPPNMSIKAIVREAAYYCIEYPLHEDHESLVFITDRWLADRSIHVAYGKIAEFADPILSLVLKQFKKKAEHNLRIESDLFLLEDQSVVARWLDKSEHGNAYWRTDFIDRQKRLYTQDCIVSDDYFTLLQNLDNQNAILDYCKLNNLSVKIVPVNIHEPGIRNRHYFTVGYKFVHLGGDIPQDMTEFYQL